MKRLILYLLLVLFVLAAVVLGGLATPIGRGIVAAYIERAASADGLTVSIDGMTGWPPFWTGAEKVTLSDADGRFAEIDDLAVDIGVRRLLTGTLAISALTAQSITVERAPLLQSTTGGEEAALAFTADRLAVAELVLGEALAGRRAVLAVEGAASSGADGGLHVELEAERVDGEGTFTASIDRVDGTAPFAADISASEAADGILVGLMGRSNGPAYRLTAAAIPQGDAVRGSVTLASEGSARFSGRYALEPDDTGKRLQVTGSGDLAGLVPPQYAELLSGPIDIAIDADWAAEEDSALPKVAIRRGSLTTAAIDAAISGTLSREVADVSLQLNIADPDGEAIPLPMLPESSELMSVSIRGTVGPSDGMVRADLVGSVAGLSVGGVSVPGTGLSLAVEAAPGGLVFGETLPFALRLEADALRTASGEVAATADAPLLVVADGTFDTETGSAEAEMDVRAAGGQVQFDGRLSTDAITGTAKAVFAETRTLAALAGQDLSGGVDATAEGTFFSASGTDLSIAADVTEFNPGEETVARLMGGAVHVTANLATDDGTITVSDFDVTGQTVQASGDVTLRAETMTASIEGAIADLSVLAANVAGSATVTADLSGALARPEVDAAIRIAEGQLLGRAIRDGIARLDGRASAEGWQGTATLGGRFAGKPLEGDVEVIATSDDGRLSLPSVDLGIGGNRITGALERTGAGLLSGTLDVSAPDVSALAALALVDAEGSADADVTFTPAGDRQTIAVAFNGNDVAFNAVTAGSLEGEATVEDAFGTPRIEGSARAASAMVGTLHLDRISANASSEGSVTTFEVAASGPDTDLTGTGSLSGDAGVNVLRLDTVSGSAYHVPVALQSPVTIRFDEGSPGLPRMQIAVGGGSVVVDGAVSPELDLTVIAERIPASLANGFVPNLDAEGAVAGRATITGPTGSPTISWQADWAGMQVAATRGANLPPLQVSASGTATERGTTLDGTVTGASGLSLALRGDVPFSGDGLSVRVTGTAPTALVALETAREVRLDGNARIDLRVTGSTSAPRYAGTATLENTTFIDGETGFGITGASGRIALDGQRASIERISGSIAQGGTISISGAVDVGGQFPANLRIEIANGRYNDGEVVNAQFNASLVVNGPLLGGATMSGRVALGRTEIQLPDQLTATSTAIDVTHVNAPASFVPPLSAEAQREAGPSPTGNLRLDIELTNSGGIFVRGFGVDAEFGGSLRVTNTLSDPQAVGAFTMRRGRIEVIGRRFELTSGLLTFAGGLTPVVDFTATTRTSDTVVEVHVFGPADDPTISFTSNPDLPEEEILSRLLFDRNVSSLSALQVAQLLDAAAQFSGGSSGQGFFSQIRDAIGVDDLDIRQNASGGTTVGLGKRINENVTVGVEAGTKSEDERVRIDLNLTPNLKATGSAGTGGSGSLGLTYEREY